jgi:hypothetical protein
MYKKRIMAIQMAFREADSVAYVVRYAPAHGADCEKRGLPAAFPAGSDASWKKLSTGCTCSFSGGGNVVAVEIPEGYYQDKFGNMQPDRRAGADRRASSGALKAKHERRKMYRRKVDRELLKRDHKMMIEEALEDFAAEHDGHL